MKYLTAETASFKTSFFLVLLLSGISFIVTATESRKDRLNEVFQYEINNRAFAFQSVPRIAQSMDGTEQAIFWQAFVRLEELSRPRYAKMAEKYGLKVNTLLVRGKTWAISLAMSLFPDKMMSVMTDATVKYVEKLKELPELAEPADRAFFEYVLAQEQAQAAALLLYRDGKYQQAADVLVSFIDSNN